MGDSIVIRDSLESSDTWILHIKVKQSGKYPEVSRKEKSTSYFSKGFK
jgi:hypothetical protein